VGNWKSASEVMRQAANLLKKETPRFNRGGCQEAEETVADAFVQVGG
jgi:hypothetical protein